MTVTGLAPDFTDADYPADPYPGTRPGWSFAHHDQAGYVLDPTESGSGWTVQSNDLDEILTHRGESPVAGREPVLAYGSNANPSKITWLRHHLGLTGMVLVVRARCHDIAAVWSAGLRARDHQRPAVLAAHPGFEDHTVWLATPQQRRVLDECEGRGQRYQLARVHTPVELDDGQQLDHVLAYTALPHLLGSNVPEHLNRSPLLVYGQQVRCADVPQEHARHLTGTPADNDGLTTTPIPEEAAHTVSDR